MHVLPRQPGTGTELLSRVAFALVELFSGEGCGWSIRDIAHAYICACPDIEIRHGERARFSHRLEYFSILSINESHWART
jgi:hypothetical protein